jgi:hypothetical protein
MNGAPGDVRGENLVGIGEIRLCDDGRSKHVLSSYSRIVRILVLEEEGANDRGTKVDLLEHLGPSVRHHNVFHPQELVELDNVPKCALVPHLIIEVNHAHGGREGTKKESPIDQRLLQILRVIFELD